MGTNGITTTEIVNKSMYDAIRSSEKSGYVKIIKVHYINTPITKKQEYELASESDEKLKREHHKNNSKHDPLGMQEYMRRNGF